MRSLLFVCISVVNVMEVQDSSATVTGFSFTFIKSVFSVEFNVNSYMILFSCMSRYFYTMCENEFSIHDNFSI